MSNIKFGILNVYLRFIKPKHATIMSLKQRQSCFGQNQVLEDLNHDKCLKKKNPLSPKRNCAKKEGRYRADDLPVIQGRKMLVTGIRGW